MNKKILELAEKWKPINGLPHKISSHGRVKNKYGRILKTHPSHGYPRIKIGYKGKHYSFSIHRLVLIAFRGPPPSGYECCHLDGKRDNNRLDNLKWGTRKENHSHKIIHGTHQGGVNHGVAAFNEKQVREILWKYKAKWKNLCNGNVLKLAKEYKVDPDTIYNIVCGYTYKKIHEEESLRWANSINLLTDTQTGEGEEG